MTCDATLNDAGRVPCQRTSEHTPHHGCTLVGLDPEATRDHEEDQR